MSKGNQNWASEVAYFIEFDFRIFSIFETYALLTLKKISIAQ